MTNARRPSREVLLSAVRRFWVVALVAGLVAGAVTFALVRGTSTTTWSGTATYVVPIAAPPTPRADGSVPPVDPRLPSDTVATVRFAAIYALLLVEDSAVLDVLAESTGLDSGEVAASTQSLAVPDSPLLRVSFSAGSEEQVRAYFDGLQRVVDERPALATTIQPGTLELLRGPGVSSSSGYAPLALVLGALVALGVGLGGALALERSDPRLRSAADVRELAGWPVLTLPEDEDDPRVAVLVQRVAEASRPGGVVAVVGPGGVPLRLVQDAASRLQIVDDRLGEDPAGGFPAEPTVPGRTARSQFVYGGELGDDGAGEALVQQSDAVVLVAPVGTRLSSLDAAVTTLVDLAAAQVVVALLERPDGRAPAPTPYTWTDDDPGLDDRGPDDRAVDDRGPDDRAVDDRAADGDAFGTDDVSVPGRATGSSSYPGHEQADPRR